MGRKYLYHSKQKMNYSSPSFNPPFLLLPPPLPPSYHLPPPLPFRPNNIFSYTTTDCPYPMDIDTDVAHFTKSMSNLLMK